MTTINTGIKTTIYNPDAGNYGPAGPPGPAGTAATIEVGTVSTGAPGSDATVVNAGTSSAAVFNFSIPSGLTGEQGEQGEVGPQGIQGEQGVRGSLWTTGSGAPTAPANVGDCYLDTATGDVWQML